MTRPTVLITGGGGMLARALADAFSRNGSAVIAPGRNDLDVTDAQSVDSFVAAERPDVVVQCAAYTRVDDAESQEGLAHEVNARGALNVASACARIGARFVYPSTDYVFDGNATRPYLPDAPTDPINAYGRSKLAGEVAARSAGNYLVVRTSWLYGAGGRNFARTIAQKLASGQPLRVVSDQTGAFTWTVDAARMIVKLILADAPTGIYHATNSGQATWHEVACEIANILDSPARIEACRTADFPTPAQRPTYSLLDCRSTYDLVGPAPHWRDALALALSLGSY